MSEEFKEQNMQKLLLMNLIMMFSGAAMQQMGKLVNPMTGKTEVSIEGAQASIDMLEMLDAKTKGNLDDDEVRLLKQTLSTLQMNFVETSSKLAQGEVSTGPQSGNESAPSSVAGNTDDPETDNKKK